MGLDVTIGGAASNSYADLTYATAYFATRPYSEKWQTAQSFVQENALITATSEMEKLDYLGTRATDTQALKWPRSGVVKPDTVASLYEITEIPKQIKDAQCEWAIALLSANILTTSELGKVSSVSLGPLSLAIKPSASQTAWMPASAARLLRGFSLNSGGVPIVRG